MEASVRSDDAVDLELERLVARRACTDSHEDPIEREESWKASVRAHHARILDENREAWLDYHRGQAERHRRTLEALITRHEAEAERLQAIEERMSA